MKFLDIYKQDYSLLKNINKDITKSIKKTDFIMGADVANFEKIFAEYCNTSYAVSCANGTDALYIAMMALGLPKNSEVIVPAMTYCSTVFSVIRAGLKPVLIDIEKNKSTMCLDQLKKKITNKTKLIIPVHLYGESVDCLKIKKIINKRKIYIIEDASQAHGAYECSSTKQHNSYRKKYRKVGSLGDISCFSLYPGKNLGAYGDAGILTTNNKKFFNYINKFRNLGSDKKFFHDLVGVNSRLDTLQAIILKHKIKNLDKYNELRKKIALIYENKINNPKIKKLEYSKGCVFHQYVIKVKYVKKFENFLSKKNIPYGRHYPYPIHKLTALKKLYKNQVYKNSEELASQCISLPIDPLLKNKDIMYICDTINSY
jgi:dTDP-4-amino-4,6-dideoxygalactose transaminase